MKINESDMGFYFYLTVYKRLMNKISLLFLLAPLFLSHSSCTCDGGCCDNCPSYHMDQEFKDYLVFSQGSYWVYQDSATLNIDSINLYSQNLEMADYRRHYGYYAEHLEQKFSSSFNNNTIIKSGGADEYSLYHSCLLFEEEGISFFTNKDIGDSIGRNNTLKYVSFDVTKNIEGVDYSSVKAFENLLQKNISQPRKIYYAKQKGIVRKELFNGEVWNLIRYHIN
jgi:hypothetical protein